MKILIASDFTQFSDYAIESALGLIDVLGGSITLVHCLEDSKKKDFTASVETKVQSALKNQVERFTISDIVSGFIVGKGKLPVYLKKLTKQESFDLVLIGSHGASGKKEFFIGSNAQKIIRSLHIPILVVKSPFNFSTMKKVLFASGFNTSDRPAFKRFLKWVKPLSPEIHLLAINTSGFFAQPSLIMHEAMKDFIKLAEGFVVKKYFYSDISIETGIRHFSDEFQVDLIGISNHDRHPIKRMFQGSNVEMLVNHSEFPILTIDYI